MKNWKALIAGFLVLCLMPVMPYAVALSEEDGEAVEYEEDQEEDSFPDSYYYPIESNETADWPQGPEIEAAGAAVMDLDTGVFVYSKNATATMYPASTTKVMTTLLLVENCDLDDEITFSDIVYDLEEGSSHLGIQPGEKMTLRDAAYGIMLASANDISNGVAEYIGGSIDGFADMMNAKAEELGCVNTHFANPHGLYREDHYTCAHDMALIAQAAYANPVFREIVTTREYTIPKTNLTDEERSFLNHQKMMQPDEDYYQEWCTGGKTGYTEDCLNTLVTFAEKDGKQFVSVVFRVNGAGEAYRESTKILEYAIDNFYDVKFEGDDLGQSFYEIMGLRYFGEASELQSPAWKQPAASNCRAVVTLPNTASLKNLTYQIVENNGEGKVLSYEYNGYPVGSSRGNFNTIPVPVQSIVQRDVEVQEAAVSSEEKIQIEGLNDVLAQTTDFFDTGYRMLTEYTENHVLTVLIAGIIILVILILLIVLLIFRCTSESRIKRRRKQEEKERRRREEEIERMTTAEIEAELRAVMEQERLRREQERMDQAEAERAAEEARIMEEKAHETERLIDELEKERQGRMAKKQ